MMIFKTWIYSAVAAMLLPTLASACEVDHFNFVWGSDAGTHMGVRNAESCKFGIKVSSRGHMDSLAVVQPPQHGTLTQVDGTHWMYRPARGYTGQDSITVKASGNQMGNRRISSGDTNITWAVDVTP